jgi:hypothetical protein
VFLAGPFDVAPGRYAIESAIADRDGSMLGTNRWNFAVTDPPPLPEGLT